MASLVKYNVEDNLALISLDQGPANTLGQPMRAAIQDAFGKAVNDSAVQAIIIRSGLRLFCAGGDITEFGTEKTWAAPAMPDLCDEIDKAQKLVIVAINGAAIGGGLELAMSGDYRIAQNNAKMSQPEVNLGILPGAGGTQRLPRLVGPKKALEMITSGASISASDAQEVGLVDKLVDAEVDLLEAAKAFANELLAGKAPLRSCIEMDVDVKGLSDTFFDDFRASIGRKARHFHAPEACIKAVEYACNLPFADGLKKERALFDECMATPQARAQQHLFFAERDAIKVSGVEKDTPVRTIKQVAIIGAGTMGGGIAMNFVNKGIPVQILDLNAEALERGLGVVRKNYETAAKKGRMTLDQVEERMNLLTAVQDYDQISDADLVIEAVFESMEVKEKVFRALDKSCKPGAILASNTSTLDLNKIAEFTDRPEDVVGLHFFSPANIMKLLEIVRGAKTSPDVLKTVVKLGKTIGKVPVVVGVCYGFVGNRMLEPYMREGIRLLLEGATPAQVDGALKNFGMAMGVLSMLDLAGLDVTYLVREARRDEIAHDPSYQILGDKLYELGRYGQKNGRGFYIYEGRNRIDDAEVNQLAERVARELGITRRNISDQEIIERCIYVLINEGANIVDECIAQRSGDCDLIYVNGYGFPLWRGGPMQFADETGLENILNAINGYRESLGEYGEMWFKPAPLLERLVIEGKSFKDFV